MTCVEIAMREFKGILKNRPKLLLSMFVIPLLYLFLFGNLFSQNSIGNIPLVVCDESQTYFSRQLVQKFEDSDRFSLIAFVDSEEKLAECLNKKEAAIGIGIPADFNQNIKIGQASEVLIEVSGINLMLVNVVITAAEEILEDFSKQVAVTRLENQEGYLQTAAIHKIFPVNLQTRILHNPMLDYQLFFLFGLLATSFQMSLFIPNAISMMIEYKSGQYIKCKPWQVVLGKILPFWLTGTLAYGILLTIAVQTFNLPARGNFFEVIVLGCGFVFAMVGLGSFLISFFGKLLVFYQLALASSVPIFILSGFTWPLHAMPLLAQGIAGVLPLTYLVTNLRSLMLAGYAVNLYKDITILFLYGIVMLCLAIYRYKKMRFVRLVKS
ncbi:ABC transporter permease [Anaerosinus massiliensis]|uniref:ABC transporter permease n=1 Tax=Massilibacillus massiliensis TaxID=1806837 RepID=UPI000DA632AD|nr:ABC transporter permease [Massilibacillus massiliensis]